MKTASAVHLIIASLLMIPVAGIASRSDDDPISFRLRNLGYLLSQLNASKSAGQEIWLGGTPCEFSWKQPADAFDAVTEDLPSTKIVDIVTAFLKDKLPVDILPEASNIIEVAKCQISTSMTSPKWVWIVEFRVHDGTPMAGAGYAQTLFVPVSTKGTVLLTIKVASFHKRH